jgi:hypothetical protein
MKEIIELLESEKWYPEHPTAHEIQVSYHLNRILDDIIYRIQQNEITNTNNER